mmetsp:Transcript_28893/g.41175  ORF Transcript_28893/g.41175 Transcript_28893/m.41175 type:complete len:150 (-) Transcript_28893:57-506(-)
MNQNILFEDIFDIRVLNESGKKFERVNRLHCKGVTYELDLVVDVNSELFDVRAGDRIGVVLTSSLTDAADDGNYNPSNTNSALVDNYDYIMHGRVFNIRHIENQSVEVQASFGGLLFRLRGEQAHVESFAVDMTFFLLMRRGGSSIMDL